MSNARKSPPNPKLCSLSIKYNVKKKNIWLPHNSSMTSGSWLRLHDTDFVTPIQTGNVCNNQHAGIPTAQRGSDASPSTLRKNLDNKAISSNHGKSVTSMVFCLCKAKAVMKDTSITDADSRLNKISNPTKPSQVLPQGGIWERKPPSLFQNVPLHFILCPCCVSNKSEAEEYLQIGPTEEGFSALKQHGQAKEGFCPSEGSCKLRRKDIQAIRITNELRGG